MSFCHIKLTKIHENTATVTYAAISPDFNETFTDEKVAEIVIDKNSKTYNYFPEQKWIEQKTIPPIFYSEPKEVREELLKQKYKGYGNGAWTGRINSWVSRLLENGVFPPQIPE